VAGVDEASGNLDADLETSLASKELALVEDVDIDAVFGLVEVVGRAAGEELLPEIPILKTLFALWKLHGNVSDALLARKIVRFLSPVQTIDAKKREAFLAQLEGEDRQRILGNLLLVLDRHDAFSKSEIQGKLFAARIRGQLTTREYLDLTHATSSMNVDSLGDLKSFYADQLSMDPENAQLFYSFAILQLVGLDNSSLGQYGGGGIEARKVSLGQKFVDVLPA
jgi:hypothetical protein